jgi:hypothetical protein
MGGFSVVSSRPPEYDERLGVPLRWWALTTMFLASVLLAFLVALPAVVAFGSVALMVGAVVATFLGYGAARVSVRDGVFTAGAAQIPVTFLREPAALSPEATRLMAGREADARAYLLVRPYLPCAVRVDVNDPDDPTPYWLVCTRHPRRLAVALAEAIDAGLTRD